MIDLSDILADNPTDTRHPRPAGSHRSRVFLTSDEHEGHEGILTHAERPFRDVVHMRETLIANHNAVVDPWDITFHLGDYAMGDRAVALAHLRRKNGVHVLISGNHDKCFAGNANAWRHQREYLDAGFHAVMSLATIKLPGVTQERPGRDVVLSHFPYRADHRTPVRYPHMRPADTGLWLVHGHVHDLYTVRDRGVNVGVDRWNYTPVSAHTVAQLIDDVEAGRRAED